MTCKCFVSMSRRVRMCQGFTHVFPYMQSTPVSLSQWMYTRSQTYFYHSIVDHILLQSWYCRHRTCQFHQISRNSSILVVPWYCQLTRQIFLDRSLLWHSHFSQYRYFSTRTCDYWHGCKVSESLTLTAAQLLCLLPLLQSLALCRPCAITLVF